MDASTRQFHLLAEIADALDRASVPFWLRGGWALDFLLGEIRADHADLDLVARRSDRDPIHAVLIERGFAFERELPEAGIDFVKAGESVQIMLVERIAGDTLVCRGFESWPLPRGALDGPLCTLEGVTCRTLAPHALRHEKETYEARRGLSLRAKDRDSLRLLRRLES